VTSRADLRRSITLFRAFLREQSDPERFYSTLAADSVRQLSSWVGLAGARVLDVGGGPGYFGRAFAAAGARYVGVELAVETDMAAEIFALCGDAEQLPIRTGAVDVAYSSNVVEHLRSPWRMADEMVRVTRPGGTIFISFTPWLSPWGGHETAPWHLLGGEYARRRYRRRQHREPKNSLGNTLFDHRVAAALAWAHSADVDVLAAFPRYHPSWAWWLARVPGVREVALWNLALVLRRR